MTWKPKDMNFEFKVITLNCWGILGISKDRTARITAIAEELANGKYDFVFLQEVWCISDFNIIKEKVESVLPYSHYFHSGVIGSGLCIFSVSRIVNTLFLPWAINGYMHKIQHGDWFGGKGIGLCEVTHKGLKINLYTAHLHAEYDNESDQYKAHRVSQSWEGSQFVKLTSRNADMVIVAGDLNSEPDQLPYRLILRNAELKDAWDEANKESKEVGATCGAPTNSYRSGVDLEKWPEGKRIDYILYTSGYDKLIQSVSCSTALPSRAPGLNVSYSDHDALIANLKLVPKGEQEDKTKQNDAKFKVLTEAMAVCEQATYEVTQHRMFWIQAAAVLIICLLAFNIPGGFFSVMLVSLSFAFSLLMATLWNNMEVNTFNARKREIELILADVVKESAGTH